MRIVELLVLRDDRDVVNAHVAFQLNAGVDEILVSEGPAAEVVADVLEPYERAGRVRIVHPDVFGSARVADADWILATDVDSFWWPRGETLADVLAVIPERYTVVQALVRPFASRDNGGDPFWERLTVRPYALPGETAELRPIQRGAFQAPDGSASELPRATIPLRAWYPVEIFDCSPGRRLEAGGIADGLAAGSLVEDARLRDLLRALLGQGPSEPRLGGHVPLRPPDIVDDAAYAVECAAVGEVDLPRLEREVADLEHRIAWLEQRFWPRVWRRLSRLGRSRS
jgi:hypothetical protein